MKKLILEINFNSLQKIILTGIALIFTAIAYQLSLNNLNYIDYAMLLVLGCIAFGFVNLAFCRNGIVIYKNKVYKGLFAFGFLFWKTQKKLKNPLTAVSILKLGKIQKQAWVSAANPDYSDAFSAYDIYLLNEHHTEKEMVVSSKKEGNSTKAIEFITEHLNIKHEIYSPNFYA